MSANKFAPGCNCCVTCADEDRIKLCLCASIGVREDGVTWEPTCTPWQIYNVQIQLSGSECGSDSFSNILLACNGFTANTVTLERPREDAPKVRIWAKGLFTYSPCDCYILGVPKYVYFATRIEMELSTGTLVYGWSGEVDADGAYLLCKVSGPDCAITYISDADDEFTCVPVMVRRRIFRSTEVAGMTFTANWSGVENNRDLDFGDYQVVEKCECLNVQSDVVLDFVSASNLIDGYYLNAEFGSDDLSTPGCSPVISCDYTCDGTPIHQDCVNNTGLSVRASLYFGSPWNGTNGFALCGGTDPLYLAHLSIDSVGFIRTSQVCESFENQVFCCDTANGGFNRYGDYSPYKVACVYSGITCTFLSFGDDPTPATFPTTRVQDSEFDICYPVTTDGGGDCMCVSSADTVLAADEDI